MRCSLGLPIGGPTRLSAARLFGLPRALETYAASRTLRPFGYWRTAKDGPVPNTRALQRACAMPWTAPRGGRPCATGGNAASKRPSRTIGTRYISPITPQACAQCNLWSIPRPNSSLISPCKYDVHSTERCHISAPTLRLEARQSPSWVPHPCHPCVPCIPLCLTFQQHSLTKKPQLSGDQLSFSTRTLHRRHPTAVHGL